MTVKFQDHFHLGFTLTGDAENAPVLVYTGHRQTPSYDVYANVERSINGTVRIQHFSSPSGVPAVFENSKIEVRLDTDGIQTAEEKRQELIALLYQKVYYVPFYHPDDGEAHTSYIRTMVLVEVSESEMLDPLFDHIRVQIMLQDASQYGYGTGSVVSAI